MEKDNIKEIKLDKPHTEKDPSKKRFWHMYYPILCYVADDENGRPTRLVMKHLADKSLPAKEFRLGPCETFMSFVDTSVHKHSAEICVLIYSSPQVCMLPGKGSNDKSLT